MLIISKTDRDLIISNRLLQNSVYIHNRAPVTIYGAIGILIFQCTQIPFKIAHSPCSPGIAPASRIFQCGVHEKQLTFKVRIEHGMLYPMVFQRARQFCNPGGRLSQALATGG